MDFNNFAEMGDLTAWNGTPLKDLLKPGIYRKLVSKHGRSQGDFVILNDFDIERARRLPLLKATIQGHLPADVYRQTSKGKEDHVQVIVKGEHRDYVVVLGKVGDVYVIRSAHPAGAQYVQKIKRDGELLDQIR